MAKGVWRRGNVFYTAVWDPIAKKCIRVKIGTARQEAERAAAELKAKLLKPGDKSYSKIPTLEEFAPRFLQDHYGNNFKRRKATATHLARFIAFVGNLKLSEISKGILRRYVSKRQTDYVASPFKGKSRNSPNAAKWTAKKPLKEGTINRETATILCMMNRAVEWDIVEHNPLSGFKKLREDGSVRKRWLQKHEIPILLDAAGRGGETLRDIIALAIYTGRRRGDILNLKRQDYYADSGYLHLSKTKSGEAQVIPLPPAAREVLNRRLKNMETDWFFPNREKTGPLKSIDTIFKRAKKLANLTDFHFHDLRHTAISYMVMGGVDYFTIAALVGHATPTMIEERYGHVSAEHKQASAKIFGEYMDKITGRSSKENGAEVVTRPIVYQVADLLSQQPQCNIQISPS